MHNDPGIAESLLDTYGGQNIDLLTIVRLRYTRLGDGAGCYVRSDAWCPSFLPRQALTLDAKLPALQGATHRWFFHCPLARRLAQESVPAGIKRLWVGYFSTRAICEQSNRARIP